MVLRIASLSVLLAFFSVGCWGQESPKPPAAVDEALRARVNEFFQYHVDKKLIKAFEIVAEETKEEYFAAAKMEITKFNITDVQYFNDFTKALVTLDVTRPWSFGAHVETVTLPMKTDWKIEEGKWMWFHDKSKESITPMGLSNISMMQTDSKGNITALPKELGTPEGLAAMAQNILKQTGGLDKTVATLTTAGSEDKIVFNNNTPGYVNLALYGIPEIAGLTIDLDKKILGPNETATILFRYQPAAGASQPKNFAIRLGIDPFNRLTNLNVEFKSTPAN